MCRKEDTRLSCQSQGGLAGLHLRKYQCSFAMQADLAWAKNPWEKLTLQPHSVIYTGWLCIVGPCFLGAFPAEWKFVEWNELNNTLVWLLDLVTTSHGFCSIGPQVHGLMSGAGLFYALWGLLVYQLCASVVWPDSVSCRWLDLMAKEKRLHFYWFIELFLWIFMLPPQRLWQLTIKSRKNSCLTDFNGQTVTKFVLQILSHCADSIDVF